jgi:hypothetical protein
MPSPKERDAFARQLTKCRHLRHADMTLSLLSVLPHSDADLYALSGFILAGGPVPCARVGKFVGLFAGVANLETLHVKCYLIQPRVWEEMVGISVLSQEYIPNIMRLQAAILEKLQSKYPKLGDGVFVKFQTIDTLWHLSFPDLFTAVTNPGAPLTLLSSLNAPGRRRWLS